MTDLYQRQGGEVLVNSETAQYQYEPTITGLTNGGFVVTWRTNDSSQDGSGTAIKAQVFAADGSAVGGEVLVNSETASYQYDPTITGLTNGGFVVTWWTADGSQDGSGWAIKAQVFAADGSAVGSEVLVNSETAQNQVDPTVTGLTNGGFVVTWRTDDSSQDGSGTAIKAQVFAADGSAVGSEVLVNSETASGQYVPTITGLTNGGFVVTWYTNDSSQDGSGSAIKAQVFAADGSAVGSEVLVNSETANNQVAPTITGLTNGGFVVTWGTSDNSQDGSGYAIKAQVFAADGSAQGSEFLVNSETFSSQLAPTITGLTNGGFVVTWWTGDGSQDGSSYAIKAQVFAADGSAVGGEFLVNSETANNQVDPTITGLTNGGFVVTWRTDDSSQDGSGSAIKAQVFGVGGEITDIDLSRTDVSEVEIENTLFARLTSQGAVNTVTSYEIISDSTNGAFGIEGNWVVVADSGKLDHETAPSVSLTIRATDIDGNSRDETFSLTVTDTDEETRFSAGAEFVVNSETANFQYFPSVTGLSNGGFVVTWGTDDITQDGSGSAIKAQVFAADGSAQGSEFLVNSETAGGQLEPTITGLSNGGFVVTWYTGDASQDGSGTAIKAQVFAADGSAVGGEVLVNSETASYQYDPTTTGLTNGGFVVTWRTDDSSQDGSGYAIKAQVFAADGSAVGGEFLVNSETVNNQFMPTITGLTNGGFVVTWWTADSSQDGSSNAIKAQVFAADGSAVGGEFLVNSETTNDQREPTITGLTNGGFVVTWWTADSTQDGSGSAIKAQVFAADGSAVGGEFLVNSETANNQLNPTITGLTNGGFVVTWRTNDSSQDGSGSAIKAQVYAADGSAVGGEFLVNSKTAGYQYDPTVTGLTNGGFVVTWQTGDGSGTVIEARVFTADGTPQNTSPVITTPDTVTVDENTTAVVDVDATDDTDSEGSGLTYALTGGADAALFDIDTGTGALSFLSAPDFETPGDDGGDNVYDVQVTATDSGGLTDVQDIAVTVMDVAENGSPTITSSATVAVDENTTDVTDVEATDDTDTEGSGLSYALTGGADAALFGIDTATGELSFLSAPDFETPGDGDGDNTYDVQVTVTDSGGLTDVQDIAVTVGDVAENGAPTITSSAAVTVDENTTAVVDVEATDDTDSESAGLTYALTGGADAALFDIDTATGELSFLSAPDFEAPGDDGGDNIYDVQVTVTDSGGLTDVQDIAVTVGDVNDAPSLGFGQGFETDTAGFFSPEGYGAVTRMSSGTGGLASPEGGFHAVFEQGGDPGSESGPFTRFDGYRDEWPGDWTASVKVYLDTGWAPGEGFDWSVAASGTNGGHLRDFIFHVTQDTSTGDLLVGISNNSNFDPNESLESGDHGVIASSGWYTLEHRFYDDGGVLAVEMRVLDAEGAEVFSGTRSNPADTIGTGGVVGGNRYGWFTNIDIAGGIGVDGADMHVGVDTGSVTELAAADPDAETLTHVVEGDLGFTDVDAGDTHTVSAAAQGAGYLGSFTATVSEATATDGVGTVTWNLEVADADLADLAEGETLVQDYVLTVEDSQGLTTTRTVSVTITGTNDGPTITSSATVAVDENTTDVTDVEATDDTDTEGSGLSYALTGGADAALFGIDTATGELSFLSAPDFETPGDGDGDNTYDVQVTVTDSGGLTDVQDIAVTVADVAENGSPTITSSAAVTVDENTTAVVDVEATDDTDSESAGLTYALTGGADAALFDIDTATGDLSFLTAPDFEAPGDDGADNVYDVQVTVTDSGGLTDVQDIAVTVADVVEYVSPIAIGLVDTASDVVFSEVYDGATVDPGNQLNPQNRGIVASYVGDGDPNDDDGSIRFRLYDDQGGVVKQVTENDAPFALFGDISGDFNNAWPPVTNGDYTLEVTAFSGNNRTGGILAMETIAFTVGSTPNTPPDANDDFVEDVPGTSLFIDVLENDFDLNDDDLELVSVTQGSQGEVQIEGDQILYLRDTSGPAIFPGDSFTYTIDDGNGGLDTATVTIAPEASSSGPPVIAPLADLVADELDVVSVPVSATDPDGNETIALSVEVLRPNGQVASPNRYSLVDNGDGTGEFVWNTPSRNKDGNFTVNVTADDGENPPVTESFNILVEDTDDDVNTPEVIYRVNAGGTQVAATDGGPAWGADTRANNSPYLAEPGSNSTANPGLPGGTSLPSDAPATVFETHRWDQPGSPEMAWEFDLPDDGFYMVRLFMRNNWNGADDAGERVFDVALEGTVPSEFSDLDPSGMFGHRVGGVAEAVVEVTDGTLDIEFRHQVQNPLVNAIEITTADDMFGV